MRNVREGWGFLMPLLRIVGIHSLPMLFHWRNKLSFFIGTKFDIWRALSQSWKSKSISYFSLVGRNRPSIPN